MASGGRAESPEFFLALDGKMTPDQWVGNDF